MDILYYYEFNEKLFRKMISYKEILCESCEGKKIKKLIDKCGNEKIARFLYDRKLNVKNIKHHHNYRDYYIRWIPFDEFRNIEYLAKGGFGEIHRATWTNYVYGEKDVVLKRIYNCSNKILNILK